MGPNVLGNQGVSVIAEALKVNTTLISQHLWWNCLKTEGASAITEALKVNTSLKLLDLYFCSLDIFILDVSKSSK
jgi:NLR family CARD domain-containing protein 3